MIRTILVPLDGLALAEQGLTQACRLAIETGATLVLVRGAMFYGALQDNLGEERAIVREAQTYLQGVQERLASRGFMVRFEVLPGDPVRSILFAAEAQHADVICMCTHGRSGMRHVLLGSVAEAVLRKADIPVVLVRGMEKTVERDGVPYHKILVPLDGSALAEEALAYLAREGIGRDATVLLMQVVPPVAPPPMPLLTGSAAEQLYADADRETQRRKAATEQYLIEKGTQYLHGWSWQTRAIVGYPGQEILHAATGDAMELIVMASHNRHGFDRLLHGSVFGEILRHIETPVLLLHTSSHASTRANAGATTKVETPQLAGKG